MKIRGRNGPTLFTPERLKQQKDLFAHRFALFYTQTENIPAQTIGAGPLDVTLPVVTPDRTCVQQIRAYSSPRFWADLLQQQSGKLDSNFARTSSACSVRLLHHQTRSRDQRV
jgi:hypothetical protein